MPASTPAVYSIGIGQPQVAAFTAGDVRDLLQTRTGSIGLGADVTEYGVPTNPKESYGSPRSFHVFLRYRRRDQHLGHRFTFTDVRSRPRVHSNEG